MGKLNILDWLYEYWLPVRGYEGLYDVSNWGRVRSLDRIINSGQGAKRLIKGKIIKQRFRGEYLAVNLWRGQVSKTYSVHRLVAEAFIPNPQNLPCINHKTENKIENFVWNLEWCDSKYNTNYGTSIKRRSTNKQKPILQFTKDGQFIKCYESKNAAQYALGKIIHPEHRTSGGFIWKYQDNQAILQ